MTRDRIAITVAAFLFALAFALPVLVRGWRWLSRRAGKEVWTMEDYDDEQNY